VETESGAGQRLGGESGAGLGQRTETPEGRRRGTAAGSGQRRRGWTAVRDAGDDLDDRDSTGRFRYGLASIGLADDEISPADEDISPAQDDMGPADDDIDSAGDGHDISRADTGGHGGGLAGAGGQARSVSSSALPKLPTPALAAHGAGQAVEGGYDEAYAAGDRAVHHDVEADRDDHDQHEVGRVEDESPDVSDITGEAAAEAPAGLVGPDGHYLDGREHYLQEPDELNHAEHPGGADQRERAAPPAMPRTWGDRRYGDRVDGWVRPHYHELPRSEGAYWTPVPEAAQYNGPFGWPIPVDRLPAVPDYEPATGFDLTPVGEPTAVVTQWPPSQPAMQWPPAQPASRLEQPRSWSTPGGAMAAQEQSFWVAPDVVEEDDRRPRRRAVMIRRGRAEPKRRGAGDPTQALPSIEHEANDQRPRPRPRPSTVYVSKHAAE
jgi:hypothetical protein